MTDLSKPVWPDRCPILKRVNLYCRSPQAWYCWSWVWWTPRMKKATKGRNSSTTPPSASSFSSLSSTSSSPPLASVMLTTLSHDAAACQTAEAAEGNPHLAVTRQAVRHWDTWLWTLLQRLGHKITGWWALQNWIISEDGECKWTSHSLSLLLLFCRSSMSNTSEMTMTKENLHVLSINLIRGDWRTDLKLRKGAQSNQDKSWVGWRLRWSIKSKEMALRVRSGLWRLPRERSPTPLVKTRKLIVRALCFRMHQSVNMTAYTHVC